MKPPADPAAHFDRKYQADADPWGYRDSWYERRKYAITLASLPRSRYAAVWEPGCSIGELTALLATRAERVDASDVSSTAISVARARTAELAGVVVTQAQLPHRPAEDRYDLVVFSEVLYYLPEPERERTLRIADDVAGSDADLVVVHWRHHPEDAWAAGEDVNAAVRARDGWRPVACHSEADFVLDVLTRERPEDIPQEPDA